MANTTTPGRIVLRIGERIALVVAIVITAFYVAANVQFTFFSLRQKLVDDSYPFSYPASETAHDVDAVWPGSAIVRDANWSPEITGTVGGLSPATVALSVAIHILGLTIVIAVAVAIIAVCVQLLRNRRPFTLSVETLVWIAGAMLAVGGSAAEILTQNFDYAVRDQITGGSCDATPIAGCSGGWNFQGIALISGLGILAVAYMFHRARTMQRDTEGLV